MLSNDDNEPNRDINAKQTIIKINPPVKIQILKTQITKLEILYLTLTGKDLIFHCTALFSGTHLALPVLVLNLGESASLGTGTRMATLLAVERLLN